MNITVNQTITIHHFRVDSVSNSSVLQIGSSGMIQGLSNLYNTGGYTKPAPELQAPTQTSALSLSPLITLR